MASREFRASSLGRFRSYLKGLAARELDSVIGRKLDPSDIVQEALLSAVENVKDFKGETDSEFVAWLRGILEHTLRDEIRRLRRKKRDVKRERPLDETLRESRIRKGPAGGHSPSSILSREETLLEVAEAMIELPGELRRVLFLRHWRGLSLKEIAQEMNRTHAEVAGLLRRAMRRVRRRMRNSSLGSESEHESP